MAIARRYLFSKGNRNVINIISGIAVTGVAIGSLAMIIVLSAFNGLESLVSTLYTSVDPDLRIEPTKGKVFDLDSARYDELAGWPEIHASAPVLEETVFLQYENQQNIVTLRGIPEYYLSNLHLEEHLVEGELALTYREQNAALLGFGIADNLSLFVRDGIETINVFAAKRNGMKSMNPENKFKSKRILPVGIVALNPEFDYTYFYTTLDFAEDLLDYNQQASYVDVTLAKGSDVDEAKEKLQLHFGDGFSVKTRIELNDLIYKTNATEKWVTFFILSFILIVATFNLVGSLSMLIIEKRKDISLLRSIGFSIDHVRRLFLFEGIMITTIGTSFGLGLGIVIILLQQYVGFFPLHGGIVEFYPVELEIPDVIAVVGVTFGIGFLASFLPVFALLHKKRLQVVSIS